jgi:predicted nucleic acid-binding Zn ribbon protein
MPIYSFKNTKTGKVYDDMMSIADKEVYLKKNKHIQQMVTKINISSGVVGVGAMRNDNGWKEMQSRIAEAHPASEFAQQHGKRTAKEIKTQAVVKKHQKRQAEQRKKYAK